MNDCWRWITAWLSDYASRLREAWTSVLENLDTPLGRAEADYEVTEASPTAGGDDGPALPRTPLLTGGAGHPDTVFSCPTCGETLICCEPYLE